MKFKTIFKAAALVLLLATLVFVFSGITGRSSIDERDRLEADGRGMVSTIFDEEHKKALEMRCSESERESEDKVWMKNIEATIFKKGTRKKDIIISGANGFVENNFYNFSITENAKITAEDLLVSTGSFYMEDRVIVTTQDRVTYRIKSLQGIAEKGMRLNLKFNNLFLYQTSGTYEREGKSFDFRTGMLKFEDQNRLLKLHRENTITGAGTVMKGERIEVLFSEDHENVKQISSWGDSYFYMEGKEEQPGEEYKEVRAAHIKHSYDPEGNLKRSMVKRNARVKLKDRANTMTVSAAFIDILYAKETGNIRHIRLPERGEVKNRGKSNFEVAANKMEIDFNDQGKVNICRSRGSSTFKTEDYTGTTFLIHYYADTDIVELQGRNSQIVHKNKNSFIATGFEVDLGKKKLRSTSGVRSMVRLEKNRVLFSDDILYVNAGKVSISDREGTFHYKEGVDLRQQETTLTADQLKIDADNNITASDQSGKVSLSFKNREDEVIIKGKEVGFDAKNRLVTIAGKGLIKSGENSLKAELLKVSFNKEDEITEVYGEKEIFFIKEQDNITGTSEKVRWLFNKDEIVFLDAAKIVRSSRGETKGKELRFFIKDNRIVISSDIDKRTETIIEKK